MDNRAFDKIALDRELVARRGLNHFVKIAWPQIDAAPFMLNWHIDLISDVLQAAFNREIRKIIINVPPGTGKSRLVSVMFPAWAWAEDPSETFLCASFDAGISERDARDMRNLVATPWFQARWPHCSLPKTAVRQVREFRNSAGGWRYSTSVGGKGTGRHPHTRIIDDPIKPADTIGGSDSTRKALDACMDWYRGTISTRQADPATTLTIVIMQRLSDRDLCGQLSEKWKGDSDFCHVMLPMEFESGRAFSFSRVIAP